LDEEGVVQAGIGGDVVEGACVACFGVRGCEDQAREPGRVDGACAHGARLQGGIEGAARQAPAARGGGCPADREQLGVGCGVPRSLALVGSDAQYLPSPGDHRPDGDLAPSRSILGGEEGATHHGEIGVGKIVRRCLNHEAIIAFRHVSTSAGQLFRHKARLLDLQDVAAFGADLPKSRALQDRTRGGDVRFGQGEGCAEVHPHPAPLQN
jgi:hypothetical protein